MTLIRIAYRDEDGEFQLLDTHEITEFGCIPSVGDLLRDTLIECVHRVRRRVFLPMIAEPDIWWLLVDEMADDEEIDHLVAFDAKMRAEFKAIAEEARLEKQQESAREIRKMIQRSKRPSHKKMLTEEFGEGD